MNKEELVKMFITAPYEYNELAAEEIADFIEANYCPKRCLVPIKEMAKQYEYSDLENEQYPLYSAILETLKKAGE